MVFRASATILAKVEEFGERVGVGPRRLQTVKA